MVNILSALGIFWNVPNTVMGLTFLAWGNSTCDLVADASLAKSGKISTSFGAIYGGPLLNVLLGEIF